MNIDERYTKNVFAKAKMSSFLKERKVPLFGKSPAEITSIISRTVGGRHFWCESNFGLIRKHINSIPRELLREFNRKEI